MWLLKEWVACFRAHKAGIRLVRMTHGSLSPVYLKYQSPIKKWFVGSIERYFLRKADRIVVTCEAEAEWVRMYLGKNCPEIVVEDIKRFFDLNRVGHADRVEGDSFGLGFRGEDRLEFGNNQKLETRNKKLNVLYLGRRHPLKGVGYLEKAVAELNNDSVNLVQEDSTRSTRLKIELKIVSNAFGEEKEEAWDWCDVLVLPTLSENFGLVVAEALERGKRVITTDGAPVWEAGLTRLTGFTWLYSGYEGRLIYLKGYRDGLPEERVRLLTAAINHCKAG